MNLNQVDLTYRNIKTFSNAEVYPYEPLWFSNIFFGITTSQNQTKHSPVAGRCTPAVRQTYNTSVISIIYERLTINP